MGIRPKQLGMGEVNIRGYGLTILPMDFHGILKIFRPLHSYDLLLFRLRVSFSSFSLKFL
jgi:hypothetical protein